MDKDKIIIQSIYFTLFYFEKCLYETHARALSELRRP